MRALPSNIVLSITLRFSPEDFDMKTFSEYLAEAEKNEKSGTYASMQPNQSSRKKLHDWLEKQEVPNLVAPEEYHVTIAYSRKPVPQIAKIEPNLPIKVKPIGWEVFGDLLVLKVSDKDLSKIFDKTREMGATFDYPEFIPHISVAKDYKGAVPNTLPKITITLDEYRVEELDLDFSYTEEK
jgi:2'-5' RNA ligase